MKFISHTAAPVPVPVETPKEVKKQETPKEEKPGESSPVRKYIKKLKK